MLSFSVKMSVMGPWGRFVGSVVSVTAASGRADARQIFAASFARHRGPTVLGSELHTIDTKRNECRFLAAGPQSHSGAASSASH